MAAGVPFIPHNSRCILASCGNTELMLLSEDFGTPLPHSFAAHRQSLQDAACSNEVTPEIQRHCLGPFPGVAASYVVVLNEQNVLICFERVRRTGEVGV